MKEEQRIIMDETLQRELINYTFRRDANGNLNARECWKLWSGKSHDTDREILTRYGELVRRAIAGEFDRWMETPPGCLALMILLSSAGSGNYRNYYQTSKMS